MTNNVCSYFSRYIDQYFFSKYQPLRIILSKLGASYLKLYRICRIRNVAPNSVDFGVSFNLVTVKLIRNWLQAGSQYGRKLEINRKCKLFCQVSVQTVRAPLRTMKSDTLWSCPIFFSYFLIVQEWIYGKLVEIWNSNSTL